MIASLVSVPVSDVTWPPEPLVPCPPPPPVLNNRNPRLLGLCDTSRSLDLEHKTVRIMIMGAVGDHGTNGTIEDGNCNNFDI